MSDHVDGGVGFILQAFVAETPGVTYAQTVSADGMHLAASTGYSQTERDTFAAIASGLSSLSDSAVETFGVGVVNRQIIEASNGWILLARISNTAAMGVVAEPSADLGLIGYEMTMLAKRLGDVLSPELIDRLKNALVGRP
jgi:predicted regulator of Ras-like GTPase activity (Roadblock/LC7/MglB family)